MENTNNFRIGDVLKEMGFVDDAQIDAAFKYQEEHEGLRLGTALREMGVVTEAQVLTALAERVGVPYVKINDLDIDIGAVGLLPQSMAYERCALVYGVTEDKVKVLMNDPIDSYATADIRMVTGKDLDISIAEKDVILTAIEYYYTEIDAKNAVTKINENSVKNSSKFDDVMWETVDEEEAPVVNLLSAVIQYAYNAGASDIHIEPFEYETLIRIRIDGSMVEYANLQASIHNSLIARIKILSDLDIAERRIPQDGHFRMKMGDFYFNIRVSVIPTVFGEKAVLRLLATNSTMDYEDTFGMSEYSYNMFCKLLESPHGIIYITGPTGSGKSTALYLVLEQLSKKGVNISTIEDPVEKNVSRLNQMQVNELAGLTFETGLRALLRQDPDIIMVGETRDNETAAISVRAAITGHLVFSTLHTNDAPSAVVRLTDMGIEPYLVANSVVGVTAQRLMKKICPHCKEDYELTEKEIGVVGKKLINVKKGKGCAQCNHTGYMGRVAIHEIMIIDKTMRKMISNGANTDELKTYAIENLGMHTLKQEALNLVEQGITTVDELMRVAYYD